MQTPGAREVGVVGRVSVDPYDPEGWEGSAEMRRQMEIERPKMQMHRAQTQGRQHRTNGEDPANNDHDGIDDFHWARL
jgi:hypothetical protein